MTTLRNALFAAAVLVSGAALQPAHAMPAASLTSWDPETASADFVFGDGLAPGRPSRLDRIDLGAAQAAAQSYFSFDAFITLGALALAGAAMAGFAAVAARRVAEENRAMWSSSPRANAARPDPGVYRKALPNLTNLTAEGTRRAPATLIGGSLLACWRDLATALCDRSSRSQNREGPSKRRVSFATVKK